MFLLLVALIAAATSAGWRMSRSGAERQAQALPTAPASPREVPNHSPAAVATLPAGDAATLAVAQPAGMIDRYADAPVLSRSESKSADGKILRVRVVKTDFKYPLLRVEDVITKDPQTGAESLTKQTVMVADHVLVKTKPGVEAGDFQAMLARAGATLLRKIPNSDLCLVQFPAPRTNTVPDAVKVLGAEANFVLYAEPDYIVSTQAIPNDSRFAELWGMNNTGQTGGTADADIDAPEAWDVTTGTPAVRIAVIDTGIDRTHPDLAANIWSNPGEIAGNGIDDDGNGYIDDIHGWDFYNEDNDPADDHGHGTHVAGTIGGSGNNGQGVAGVCWNVSLIGLKFLGSSGFGTTSDATEATLYATRIGVKLSSNSWGGGTYTQALKDAIDAADAAGILFVVAAGNAGSNNDAVIQYPSGYTSANIIAVAATDRSDALASFSSYGATTVDLAAPGVDILSSVPGATYAIKSGTSMATPHVAGACALLWSYRPALTHREVKAIILSSVDPIPAMAGKAISNGRLNVYRALVNSRPAFLTLALDSDPGWQRDGGWAFGPPAGGGGSAHGKPDPTSGATGTRVFGVNLNGDYSVTPSGPHYLTAGPFDFTNRSQTILQFQRWLNTDSQPRATAIIEVSSGGGNWTQVWSNGTLPIADSAWTLVDCDISQVADGQPNVRVRWSYQANGGALAYSGWNIDDIAFLGNPPLVVTTLADENNGALGLGSGDSLREAITAAAAIPGADFIGFAPSLNGGTIMLGGTQLTVNSDVKIDASNLPAGAAVSGNLASRVFEITAGRTVSITGLTVTGGKVYQGQGGGVFNQGILHLDRSTVSGNSVFFGDGGGIMNSGSLGLVNSTVANNHAQEGSGGGISNKPGNLTMIHTAIANNSVWYGGGGGVFTQAGTLAVENSIIAGNSGYAFVPDDLQGGISASSGANITSGDPMLAPLADYGGPTKTMPPLPGSPAIDAAIPLASTPPADQRGGARPRGPLPDLGAVEAFPFSSLPLVDTDGDLIDDRLEPAYHLTVGVNDSGVDSDGDGSGDAEEIANMTDPLDADSFLKIISFTRAAGFDPVTNPRFDITFTSFPGLSYSLECDGNLDFSSPQALVQPLGAAGGFTVSVQLGLLPGRDFVRVRRDR